MGLGATMSTERDTTVDVRHDPKDDVSRALSIIAKLQQAERRDGGLTDDSKRVLDVMERRVRLAQASTDGAADDDEWRKVPTGWTAVARETATRTLMVRPVKANTVGNVRCSNLKCTRKGMLMVARMVRPTREVESGARTKLGHAEPASAVPFVERLPGRFVCSEAHLSADTQYKQDRTDKSNLPLVAFRRDAASSRPFTEPKSIGGKSARRSGAAQRYEHGTVKHRGPSPEPWRGQVGAIPRI